MKYYRSKKPIIFGGKETYTIFKKDNSFNWFMYTDREWIPLDFTLVTDNYVNEISEKEAFLEIL